MPNPKRIIPVSEVKPGDSMALRAGRVDFVIAVKPTVFGGVSITAIDNIYYETRVHGQWAHGATAPVTIGYTNRKAKRARGKMARRARKAIGIKAGRIRGVSHTFTWLDEPGSWPTDAQV